MKIHLLFWKYAAVICVSVLSVFGASAAMAQQSGSAIATAVYQAISGQCWACSMYGSLVNGLNTLFTQMFQFFAGSTAFVGLCMTCVVISLLWRVMRFFSPILAPEHEMVREWEDIVRFIGRTVVVFCLFLSTEAATAISTGSTTGTVNIVRDFFVDGPLATGTSLGCLFINQGASQVGTGASITCQAPSDDSTSWMALHVSNAQSILMGFHKMGVTGLSLGVETVTSSLLILNNYDVGTAIAVSIVGISICVIFMGFTVTFGLRYVDAALKAMVSLSLAPVFAVLWIFDRTRPIAFAAMRSVFFMMALFAVSGVAFIMALAVMNYGFNMATGHYMIGTDPSSISMIHAAANQGGGVNWFSYAILLGSWGAAIGIAGSSFKIAEELVSFGGSRHQGEYGVGQDAGGKMMSGVSSGAKGMVGMIGGK